MIVASHTAGGDPLREVILARVARGPCRFTLLVPADRDRGADPEADERAHQRLGRALAQLGDLELDLKGVVGDADVILAINDLLLRESFDEIILSTLPPGISRWLKQDLPHRVSRRFATPTTHVIGTPDFIHSG